MDTGKAIASWKALSDAAVVPDGESFCSYVSVDDDVVTTVELTDDDVVLAVTRGHGTSDDECVQD